MTTFCMGGFNERIRGARYAKLVLREARLAEEDVASKLIDELLHDLKSFQNFLSSARAP